MSLGPQKAGAVQLGGRSVEPEKALERAQVWLFMACWWRDNSPYEEQLNRGTVKLNQEESQRERERETKGDMNKNDS